MGSILSDQPGTKIDVLRHEGERRDKQNEDQQVDHDPQAKANMGSVTPIDRQ
jgi:hypothetical protein